MYPIYSNTHDDAWRFTLGKPGKRKLLVIGLNPSTATREKSDVTVAKVETVCRQNGFDGFVMLNLYPVRSTVIRHLPIQADMDAFDQNIAQISRVVAAEPSPVIWAAWGSNIESREYFSRACLALLESLRPYDVSWRHFGPLTKIGHPRHPSRAAYSWELGIFDATRYEKTLCV